MEFHRASGAPNPPGATGPVKVRAWAWRPGPRTPELLVAARGGRENSARRRRPRRRGVGRDVRPHRALPRDWVCTGDRSRRSGGACSRCRRPCGDGDAVACAVRDHAGRSAEADGESVPRLGAADPARQPILDGAVGDPRTNDRGPPTPASSDRRARAAPRCGPRGAAPRWCARLEHARPRRWAR